MITRITGRRLPRVDSAKEAIKKSRGSVRERIHSFFGEDYRLDAVLQHRLASFGKVRGDIRSALARVEAKLYAQLASDRGVNRRILAIESDIQVALRPLAEPVEQDVRRAPTGKLN